MHVCAGVCVHVVMGVCVKQEIKIQEQVQKLAIGTIPRAMWVVLEDDLVDSVKVSTALVCRCRSVWLRCVYCAGWR